MKSIEFTISELALIAGLIDQAKEQADGSLTDEDLIQKDERLSKLKMILDAMKNMFPQSTEIPGMEKTFKELVAKEREEYSEWCKKASADIKSIHAKLETHRLELEDKK